MIKIKLDNGRTVAGPFHDEKEAKKEYNRLVKDKYNEEEIHITNFG